MNHAAVDILVAKAFEPAIEPFLGDRFVLHRLWQQSDPEAYLKVIGPAIRGVATTAGYGAIGTALLDALPNLEIIASFGVGYDHIDAAAAAERGVVVSNTPDVLDDDVADLALGLTLATLRQIPLAERHLREGRWLEKPFPLSPTLRGRTIGLLGLGRIGKAIARRFEGFGVTLAYHSRRRQPDIGYAYCDSAVSLAAACDVLIVIVPGGASTRHLVDGDVLAALGSDGVLINVARGSVVDEAALVRALAAGTILAAGLDVYAEEPRVLPALLALKNVVLLPHIGSGTIHTRRAMSKLVADNLTGWFFGDGPLTPVPESASAIGKRHNGRVQNRVELRPTSG